RQTDRPAVSAPCRTDGHGDGAWRARRHGERRRHQARHARDRPVDPRAALHQGRREGQGAHRNARVRRPRMSSSSVPLVSAIVVNWNGGPMLLDALESLFVQTWPALEVILVDNASTDGSAEAARGRFGCRLKVVQNTKNL